MHIKGKETSGPKNVLSITFTFLSMLSDRNILRDTFRDAYNECVIRKIADRIEEYAEIMTQTYEKLKESLLFEACEISK